MVVVAHNGVGEYLESKGPCQFHDACFYPILAMRERPTGCGIESAQAGPSHTAGIAMVDPNFLMIDKLAELTQIQTSAIKELDIDKVVVYDNGSGKGVSNFVQGLYGMMPQLNDFLSQSGMTLPDGLVKKNVENEKPSQASNTTNNNDAETSEE